MKIIAFSKDGDFVKIGTPDKSYWYGTAKVRSITDALAKGDEVKIKYDKNAEGRNVLSLIEKLAGGTHSAPSAPAPALTGNGSQGPAQGSEKRETFQDSQDAKNTTIRSQAIGKMVGAALISLQGQVDTNNICSIIDTLYQKFDSVIK